AVTSVSQAVASGTQTVTSDSQAITYGTQAVTSDSQAITSGTQAVTSDSQAITSGTQAVTSDSQAIALRAGSNHLFASFFRSVFSFLNPRCFFLRSVIKSTQSRRIQASI